MSCRLSYVILYVNDVEKSIEFYSKAFGLKHKFTHESLDYGELDTGTCTLAFCKHSTAQQIIGSSYIPARPNHLIGSQITLTPHEIEKTYQRALELGAKSLAVPTIKPWNFHIAMIQDLDGHIIELAKPVSS